MASTHGKTFFLDSDFKLEYCFSYGLIDTRWHCLLPHFRLCYITVVIVVLQPNFYKELGENKTGTPPL